MRKLVVVGSSAGGLEALAHVLGQLPPSFSAAIALVQHVQAAHTSVLAGILARRTGLRVKEVVAREPIQAGVVYIAPPDRHLIVAEGPVLEPDAGPALHFLRPAADVLFASAARVCGAAVIGVILTGSGTDGSAGATAIKMAGGVVIAQDTPSSAFPSMPEHAVATGAVDFVLPLDAIAAKLVALTGATAT